MKKETLRKKGRRAAEENEAELRDVPDIYYVLAWNFKKEILERNRGLIEKGVEFFFPVNPPEG